jgi:hypothetical protein
MAAIKKLIEQHVFGGGGGIRSTAPEMRRTIARKCKLVTYMPARCSWVELCRWAALVVGEVYAGDASTICRYLSGGSTTLFWVRGVAGWRVGEDGGWR